MKLTCVTATFNAIKSGNRENLIRCVNSVAALKTEHEHLIYDGASTDGTVELLRELEAKTPGLKVVSEPDTGIYNALNKGVRDAKGEWFYVLGCDDYIFHPEVMDLVVAELNDAIDACATTVRRLVNAVEYDWFTTLAQLDEIFVQACICHQGEIIRTSLARNLNGFDESYKIAADSDMFFKAHLVGARFYYKFVNFAYFSEGGASASNLVETSREHRESVANALGLRGRQKDKMINECVLPYTILIKLLRHSDLAIRQSARKMMIKRIRNIVRILIYPVVIITRPMRNRLRESSN